MRTTWQNGVKTREDDTINVSK